MNIVLGCRARALVSILAGFDKHPPRHDKLAASFTPKNQNKAHPSSHSLPPAPLTNPPPTSAKRSLLIERVHRRVLSHKDATNAVCIVALRSPPSPVPRAVDPPRDVHLPQVRMGVEMPGARRRRTPPGSRRGYPFGFTGIIVFRGSFFFVWCVWGFQIFYKFFPRGVVLCWDLALGVDVEGQTPGRPLRPMSESWRGINLLWESGEGDGLMARKGGHSPRSSSGQRERAGRAGL